MKKYSKKKTNKRRKNPALDLFGEVPVTWPEVNLWVEVITRGKFSSSKRNFMSYVHGYDVIGKIKAAKRDYGSLEAYFSIAANDDVYAALK